MLDILCVRVHDSNTLILVFFIHCENTKPDCFYEHTGRNRYWFPTTNLIYVSVVATQWSLTQTFPDPDTLVTATCRQQIPWRGPRHTFDLILMSFQHSQTLEDKGEAVGKLYKSCSALQSEDLNISSYLKVVVLLFPDACGCIKAGRGQIIPTGRPCHLPNGALVSVLKHTLTNPRIT